MPSYWLVGAVLDGHDSMAEHWVPWGIWMVFYEQGDRFNAMAREMAEGDRIALKEKSSQYEFSVRHLGVIRGRIHEAEALEGSNWCMSIFAVDWIQADIGRTIPFEGTPGVGAGIQKITSLPADHARTREIFRL